jgi:hypothetical protein
MARPFARWVFSCRSWEDVAETALFCVSLPPGACATQVILLPTDDRQLRDRARAIEAMTAG